MIELQQETSVAALGPHHVLDRAVAGADHFGERACRGRPVGNARTASPDRTIAISQHGSKCPLAATEIVDHRSNAVVDPGEPCGLELFAAQRFDRLEKALGALLAEVKQLRD